MRPFGPIFFEPANEWKNVRAREFSRAARGSVRARSRPGAWVSDLSARRYALTTGLGSGHARAERHVLQELHGGLVSYLLSDSECVRFARPRDASVIPVRLARHLPGLARADGVDREAGASRARRHRTSQADGGGAESTTCVSVSDEEKAKLPRFLVCARPKIARKTRMPDRPPKQHSYNRQTDTRREFLFAFGSNAPSPSEGRAWRTCRVR